MKCQNCGNEFASGKFCSECGALLPAEEAVKPEVTANSVKAEAPAAVPMPEEQAKVFAESAAEEKPAAEEAAEKSVAEAPAAEEGVTEEQGAPVAEENAPQSAGETVSGSAPESALEAVSGNAPESAPEVEPLPVAETGGAAETAADAAQTQNAPGSAGGNGGSSNAKFEEIKGKIRAVCEKVKAKLGEKAYKGIGLWTPAVLPVVWGVLIMLFLAASGVSVDGFSFGSGYDVMSGSFGGGAAFGAVMCLLIALAYIGIGIFRIVLAVKKPYFTPKFVVPTQLALYGLLFLMSCVMVGSVNTVMGGAYSGPAGNCVLAFTLLGAFFVAAGILLFRFGCVDELVQARKTAAAEYAEERKNKIAAAQAAAAAAANAAQAAAAAGAAAVSAGAAGASAQVVYVQGKSEPSMEDKLFGDLPVGKKIENYRWSGAVASLVAVLFIAIAGVLPLLEYNGAAYSGFSFVYTFFANMSEYSSYYTYVGDYVLSIFLFVLQLLPFALCALFAFLHLLIAIRQPYTQHPIFGMFQWLFTVSAAGFMTYIVVWNGIVEGLETFGYTASTIISLILLTLVLAGCIFGVPLYIICARTDQNRYAIKKKRLEIKENPESDKSNATPRKIFAVVVAVIALVTFILSVCMPLMVGSDRGMDTDTARSLTPGTSYSRVVEQLGEPYKVSDTSNGGKVAYWYSKDYRDIMGESSGSSGSDLDDIEDWEDLENALEDEMQAEAEREQQLNNLVYKYYEITFDSYDQITYIVFDNNCAYRSSALQDKVLSRSYAMEFFYASDTLGTEVGIEYSDGSYEAGYVRTFYSFAYDAEATSSSGEVAFEYDAKLADDGVFVFTRDIDASDIIDFGNAAFINAGSDLSCVMRANGTAKTNVSLASNSLNPGTVVSIDYTLTGIDGVIETLAQTGRVSNFTVVGSVNDVLAAIAFGDLSGVAGGYYSSSENGSLYTSSSTNRKLLFASYEDTSQSQSIFETLRIRTVGSYAFNYYNSGNNSDISTLPSMGPGTSGYTGVTTLEDYAFAGSTFTSVTIPSCVRSVGSYVFYGCDRGSVTLAHRTSVPSSWASDWNVYNSGNNVWTVYDGSGNLI